MNKQTTIEEFEQNMTEYLPDFTKNTKKGGNVWTKVHVCNPERPFPRSWKMTINAVEEEGYVKNATFALTYALSLQYAADNGSAAGIPAETARIPMYRDGEIITTFKGVRTSAELLVKKVEQVMELAEKFEREFWDLNQTSRTLASLERDMF